MVLEEEDLVPVAAIALHCTSFFFSFYAACLDMLCHVLMMHDMICQGNTSVGKLGRMSRMREPLLGGRGGV